jgi:hypothetical protein
MAKFTLQSNQYIPYKPERLPSGMPACKTYYYIVNENGKVINKYTLKPYKGKQMYMYAFHDKLYAEQFLDNINKSVLTFP